MNKRNLFLVLGILFLSYSFVFAENKQGEILDKIQQKSVQEAEKVADNSTKKLIVDLPKEPKKKMGGKVLIGVESATTFDSVRIRKKY